MALKRPPERVVIITTGMNGGVAGWFAKIEAPEALIDQHGNFRELASNLLEAELKAAACGLALAKSRGLLRAQTQTILQVGSLEAIGVARASDSRYLSEIPRATHVPACCVEAVAAIRKVRDQTGALFELRLIETRRAA